MKISVDDIELDPALVSLLPADSWEQFDAVPLFSIEDYLVVARLEGRDGMSFFTEMSKQHEWILTIILEVPKAECDRALVRLKGLARNSPKTREG